MAKKKEDDAHAGWMTRQEIARCFDVRPEHFDKTFREHVPDRMIAKAKRRVLFDPRAVRAVLDGQVAAEKEKHTHTGGDDMLVGDGQSPAMERYRLARAKIAEADLAERDGETVRVSAVESMVMSVASRVRAAGDRLGRKFGVDAQDVLLRALDDLEGDFAHDDRGSDAS